jgi:hypothetical protein
MTMRPTAKNRVLATDGNGRRVTTTSLPTSDFAMDDLTCTTLTASTVTANLFGNVTGDAAGAVTGNITGGINATSGFIKNPAIVVSTANAVLTAAQSGGTWVGTSASGTQSFVLPAPAIGLTYNIVCGHASGEILVNTNGSQTITGKGFATSAGTGIKGTAATNVVGDAVQLMSDGTNWFSTYVTGVWASQ